MKIVKQGIIFFLVITLLLSLSSAVLQADATENTMVTVTISNGETQSDYQVIADNGDLYFPAEAYGKVTNYKFLNAEAKYGFTLGRKIVSVDKKTGDMQVHPLQHNGKIPMISENGVDYLSASAMLPWLNVKCTVRDGILEILPDGTSLWEAIDNFSYNDYMFNVYQQFGDSTTFVVGWEAMTIFDTFVNLRWNRLIPTDISFENGFNVSTLYDYECYVDTLVNLMQPEINSEKLKNGFEKVEEWNKILDVYLEEKGIDEKKIQLAIDDYYRINGDYEETREFLYQGTQTWLDLREVFRNYDNVKKYMDLFYVLKMCEIILEMDTEYRDYIDWLADRGTDNTVFDNALKTTSSIIDRNDGIITAYYLKLISNVMTDIPDGVVDAIANRTMNDTIIKLCNDYKNGFFGSVNTYMAIAKVVYSTIFPVADGFEAMAKIHVTESIQDYCWSLADELETQEMTKDNIAHIRQSYLTALRTSKIAFEGKQELIDVKLLGIITIFDGAGLLDGMIARIDNKIMELTATVDATENDSVEGKNTYTEELKEMFAEIIGDGPVSKNWPTQKELFDESCWIWASGSTSASQDVVKFYVNGILEGYNMESGAHFGGTYGYSSGVLTIEKNKFHYDPQTGTFENREGEGSIWPVGEEIWNQFGKNESTDFVAGTWRCRLVFDEVYINDLQLNKDGSASVMDYVENGHVWTAAHGEWSLVDVSGNTYLIELRISGGDVSDLGSPGASEYYEVVISMEIQGDEAYIQLYTGEYPGIYYGYSFVRTDA